MANRTSDSDEQRRISEIRVQLNKLFDAHSCSICHDVLNAPVSLPCRHYFCSECVRRHLLNHSVCPHPHCSQTATATTLTPQRSLDDMLAPVRAAFSTAVSSAMSAQLQQRHTQKLKRDATSSRYLVCFSHRDPGARPKLIEKLRQNDLPVSGNLRVLAARYREFVLKWNANLDANLPQSKRAIAELVMKEEKVRDFNNNGSGFAASSASGHAGGPNHSSFFKKSRTDAKAAIEAGDDVDEDADDVVAEGDDFDTLIRKTRLRDVKRKRALEHEREQLEKSRLQNCLLSPPSKRHRDSSSDSASMEERTKCSQPIGSTVVSAVCIMDVRPKSPSGSFVPKRSTRPPPSPACVNIRGIADARRHRVTASVVSSAPSASQLAVASGTTFSQRSVHIARRSPTTSTCPPLSQQPADQTDSQDGTNSGAPVITDEIRQRIERNRRIALDRKRRYNERMEMQKQEVRPRPQ